MIDPTRSTDETNIIRPAKWTLLVAPIFLVVGFVAGFLFTRGSTNQLSLQYSQRDDGIISIEVEKNTLSISNLMRKIFEQAPENRHTSIYQKLANDLELIHTSFLDKITRLERLDPHTETVKNVLRNKEFYYLKDSKTLPPAIEQLKYDELVSEELRTVSSKPAGPWKKGPFRVLFTFPGSGSNIADDSIAVCQYQNSYFVRNPGYYYLKTDRFKPRNFPVLANAGIDINVCREIAQDPLGYLNHTCINDVNIENFENDFDHTRLVQINDSLKQKLFGQSLAASVQCYVGVAGQDLSDVSRDDFAQLPSGARERLPVDP